jgi:hypothetical protein
MVSYEFIAQWYLGMGEGRMGWDESRALKFIR